MHMPKQHDERVAVLAEIKAFLEQEYSDLHTRLQLMQADSLETPTAIKEDIDESVQNLAEASVKQTVDSNIERQLRDIQKALERIESGIYGICKYCEQDIALGRLKARPTSTSCVSCKKTLTHEM